MVKKEFYAIAHVAVAVAVAVAAAACCLLYNSVACVCALCVVCALHNFMIRLQKSPSPYEK